ncbi:hypothetical protein F383_31037 [Gossypium arboreum]|uniref:Uncharacterized protein n=1 Tax=Gossypium arboreum TaxID=29729 RepID=A0A0B0PKY6_GOSAR|nr:hypothetical protein F383_31037 [Gossypium arboreum]
MATHVAPCVQGSRVSGFIISSGSLCMTRMRMCMKLFRGGTDMYSKLMIINL